MSREITVQLTPEQIAGLNDGKRDAIRVPDTGKQPNTTPIAATQLDQTHDIMGVVRSVDDKNVFDRDDGSQGQVRNIRIQDRTGDLRLAMWGEHADLNLELGDYVHILNVDIEDGYEDTFEGNVGWDSSVRVVEKPDDEGVYVTVEVASDGEQAAVNDS